MKAELAPCTGSTILLYSRHMTLHELTFYSTHISLIVSDLSVLIYKMGMMIFTSGLFSETKVCLKALSIRWHIVSIQ